MNIKQRMSILKQSQTSQQTEHIDIRSIPNFRPQLFQQKPDIIENLNIIINIINKYLVLLSNGKVNFDIVWKNPSVTGSEFVNSIKNLLNLAKWIYDVIRSQNNFYTLSGLKQIAIGLIDTVKTHSFPEPQAATVQNELESAGQIMLSKLE